MVRKCVSSLLSTCLLSKMLQRNHKFVCSVRELHNFTCYELLSQFMISFLTLHTLSLDTRMFLAARSLCTNCLRERWPSPPDTCLQKLSRSCLYSVNSSTDVLKLKTFILAVYINIVATRNSITMQLYKAYCQGYTKY